MEKKQKLRVRLGAAIRKNHSEFNCELDEDEKAAFMALGFSENQLAQPWVQDLPLGFVDVVSDVFEKHKNDEALTRGNLYSKIIGGCMSKQQGARTLGGDPSDYYWPPEFQDLRDKLRAEERECASRFGRQ